MHTMGVSHQERALAGRTWERTGDPQEVCLHQGLRRVRGGPCGRDPTHPPSPTWWGIRAGMFTVPVGPECADGRPLVLCFGGTPPPLFGFLGPSSAGPQPPKAGPLSCTQNKTGIRNSDLIPGVNQGFGSQEEEGHKPQGTRVVGARLPLAMAASDHSDLVHPLLEKAQAFRGQRGLSSDVRLHDSVSLPLGGGWHEDKALY